MTAPLELYGQPQSWLTAIYRKRFAFHLIVAEQRYFRRDFMDWLITNWKIWLAFEFEADRIWNSGRRHYSARTIGEFLRHMTMLEEGPNEYDFKINNNQFPDLARLYMLMHPDREEFFERRLAPLSVRAA